MSGTAIGILMRIASGALFVSQSAIVRFLAGEVPAGQLVFYRSFYALAPLIVFLAWRGELPRGLITRRVTDHTLRSIFGCAGMFAGFVTLRYLPLAEAQALNFVSPIFLVLLAGVILGEIIRPVRWVGVILGLAGVLVMVGPELGQGHAGTERLLGSVLAIGGALMGALAGLQIRRLGSTESPGSIAFYFAVLCTLVSFVTWPFGWVELTAGDRALLILMGLTGGIAQILMTLAFQRVEASVLAPFDYLSMVWALLYGVLIFGEWPGPWTFAGAAVVLSATALVAHVEGRRRSG